MVRRTKWLGAAVVLCQPFFFGSCSDFSDYNEAPVDNIPSGNLTLWENIQQNSQLSDFAQLVRKSGFDAELSSPRSFTVWAPANGSFSMSEYENMPVEDLLNQLVKGHIANYSHTASGSVDTRVHMLNNKSFTFAGNGQYSFGDLNVTKANIPSNNGLIHMIDGVAHFFPNVYEFLHTCEGIDSLRNHFMRYELTTLDKEASVKGPMVNGAQTYIDSVMVTSNELTRQLNARLENEDSSYTMLLPTDKAFGSFYSRLKSCYNFITTTTVADVDNYASATDTKTKYITIDPEYMADSLVRRAIVNNLVYSNNDIYNKWLIDKGEFTDTMRSTTRNKFSNPKTILAQTIGDPIEMSNGYVRVVDSLAFMPWEAYNDEIEVSPRNYLSSLFPASAKANRNVSLADSVAKRIFGEDKDVSNYRYMHITPGGDRAKPDFFINLPRVLSTTYNFYVVFLPAAWKELGRDTLPNWLNFELSYCAANGNVAKYCFSKAYADSLRSGGTLPKVPTSVNATTAFTNDPAKCDTIFIGQFTFPVAYRGLGEYYPSIRVTSPISVFSTQQLQSYTRDIRIAAILMRPVEKDEYEAKNK